MFNPLEKIFEVFVAEGRELSFRELKSSYPNLVVETRRKYPNITFIEVLKKVRRVYSSRWEEIYPKPKASLTILDKMRIAASKK